MIKYPDEIIIQKVVSGADNPYSTPVYQTVYRGRCRFFLNKQSAYSRNNIATSDYQIVIPDRNMVDIGENFKVALKSHTTRNGKAWDIVGYARDFARYDRVCNLWIEETKDNVIIEDIPENTPSVRTIDLHTYDMAKTAIVAIFTSLEVVQIVQNNRSKINLGSVNLAKLNEEEKRIATDKGWELV